MFISQCSKRNYRRLPVRIKTCTKNPSVVVGLRARRLNRLEGEMTRRIYAGPVLAHGFLEPISGRIECAVLCVGVLSVLRSACIFYALKFVAQTADNIIFDSIMVFGICVYRIQRALDDDVECKKSPSNRLHQIMIQDGSDRTHSPLHVCEHLMRRHTSIRI